MLHKKIFFLPFLFPKDGTIKQACVFSCLVIHLHVRMLDWRNVVKRTQMWRYQQGCQPKGWKETAKYQLYRTKRGSRFKISKRASNNNSKLYQYLRYLCRKRQTSHIPEQQAPLTMKFKEQFYLTCVSDFHQYFLHRKWHSSQAYIADMSTSEFIRRVQRATCLAWV